MSSRQGLYRHTKNTRKCLEIQQKGNFIVKESIQPIPTPKNLQSIPIGNLSQIELLERQLYMLKNPVLPRLTKEQEQNLEIQRLNKVVEEMKSTIETLNDTLSKYKELHDQTQNEGIERPIEPVNPYSLNDDKDLEFFDLTNPEQYHELHEYIHSKYKEEHFKMGEAGLQICYSFFFPKYYRCTDKKRYVFKYMNKDGQIVKDNDLSHLYKTIAKVLYEIAKPIFDRLMEQTVDPDLQMEFANIFYDDIVSNNRTKYVFQGCIKRIIDLSDGKEVNENVHKMSMVLNKI
jgi:hypothetical protein